MNLNIPINKTSYGIVSTNIASILDCTIYPINQADSYIDVSSKIYSGNDKHRFDMTVKIWHQNNLIDFPATKGEKIGFPFFELDGFTDQEKLNINYPDRIFCTSKWAADVLYSTRAKGIEIVPLGVDIDIFSVKQPTVSNMYKFLHIGKLEHRKSQTELVAGFNAAFSTTDNVSLILLIDNQYIPEHVANFKKWAKDTPLGNKITFISSAGSAEKLKQLYHNCNCYISASKAEGWDLPLLEAMSCGLPVIATNNTAHTEFCIHDGNILIDTPEKEIAYDGVFFKSRHASWHKVNQKMIADSMRAAYETQLNINLENRKVAERFTWKDTATKILALR